MRTLLRAAATSLLSLVALPAIATPALAHTSLLSSDPADGAVLGTAPDVITLTFTDPMQAEFSTVTVTAPDGADTAQGLLSDGNAVVVTVAPLTRPGRHEIGYRVLSQDGHPVTGTLAFTLDLPSALIPTPTTAGTTATATSVAATATTDAPADGAVPAWRPWVLAALVLVGGGVGAALRLGRGQ
jgi:copper resistance protein C